MLYLCIGENVFQRDQEVAKLVAGREAERYDGAELQPERLGEVFAGQSLFSANSVVIVDGASLNKPVWEALELWAKRSDDTDVILLEQKVDKRTKTYKALQKIATVIACEYWTERQRPQATAWLKSYARKQGVAVPSELLADMIERSIRPSDVSDAAIIDQQRLARAVQQLRHAQSIDRQALDTVLAPSVHENVFNLFAASLEGRADTIRTMIAQLKRDQDGHRMFGLLGSQAGSLTALVLSGERSVEEVARDIGAHPFALKQLARYRHTLGREGVAHIVTVLADADVRLKRSEAEPWVLIEKALVEIALQQKTSR